MSTAKRPKSKVWDHFEPPTTANPNVTTCKKCNKQLSYKSTSTSAMARHLKSQHNIHINESETSGQSSTSNQTNEQFSRKQSINSPCEAIARCALDEMSIKTILSSEILKDYLDKVHHSQLPKTEEEIHEIILEYYNQVVEKYKLLFEEFKTKNAEFLITFELVFYHAKIIDKLLFLKYYFLNKAELAKNEQTIQNNTVTKLSSQVWHYFAFKPDNPKVTICQITSNNVKCNKSMSYSSSSTSAMARHLKSQHNIDIDLLNNTNNSTLLTNSQSTIKKSNKSIGEILSQCAIDGMSISTIVKSEVIKDYLNKVHHHKMSNSEEEIKELIVEFYNQAVDKYKNMFEHFKSKGTRFSVGIKNAVSIEYFYLSDLSVHCNVDSKIESFYLQKEKYNQRDELDKTLRIFGLDLNSDIIAGTCDYNHVELSKRTIVQFSMKDVFKRAVRNLECYGDIFKWHNNLYECFLFSTPNLNVLQRYVDVGDGEMIEFVFKGDDWISRFRKSEQLLKLQPYIKEAFESGELKFDGYYTKSEVYYDEHKFNELQNLAHCLKPFVEAQEELDKPNTNLLTAEVVMKYVFMKLRQIDSDMSREMIANLNVKYKETRNQNIVSLMYFLKHRKYPIDGFEIFEYFSKDEIIETANKLNQRLFPEKNPNQQIPLTNSPNFINCPNLIEFLNSEMCDTAQDVHLDVDLTSHFELAQKTKTLTPQLERLYKALISIRPSVVELELKKFYELEKELNFLKHYFIRKDAKQINQQKRPIEQ